MNPLPFSERCINVRATIVTPLPRMSMMVAMTLFFPFVVVGPVNVHAQARTRAAKGRVSAPQVGTSVAAPGIGDAGPLSLLLPKLATAPAPKWVRPGLRLTYYGASASVAGSGKDWRIDPEGGFQTPDGRRWSGADKQGAGGQGFTHYDIVAVNPDRVAIAASSYIMLPGSAPSSTGSSAFLANPGAAGDLWVNPAVLKQLANRTQDPVRISRTPYKIGNSSRPAVWVYTTTASGYTLYVYDEETGVMLHYSASASGAASPVISPNELSNTGNTQLVTTTLVAQRVITLPWANDPVPSWVATLHTLQYAGKLTTFIPGAPPLSLPVTSQLTKAGQGKGWVRLTGRSSVGGGTGIPPAVSQSDSMNGSTTLGFWISPEGLARLHPGQLLDRDPATGVVAAVAGTSRTPDGKQMTVISLKNPIEQTDLGYDVSNGMLIYINRVQRIAPATNQTQLFLRSAQ